MENEELRTASAGETETPETESRRIPKNPAPLEKLEADGETTAPETRMTPEYLRFLEEKEKQYAAEAAALESSSRTLPVPEPDGERKKRALSLQMDHQKQIIRENRRAWFGRRRSIRREAEARLAELEKEYAALD